MNTHLGEELSAYVDGRLAGVELERVESHVAACAECRATLDDLRRVVRQARALDDRPPTRELWGGISSRIGGGASRPADAPAQVVPLEQRRRRFSFTMPQLAAAALALIALSAASASLLVRGWSPATAFDSTAFAADISTVSLPARPGMASYDAAISDVERTLAEQRPLLDTATVRVLEQSLAVIDEAIAQARAALAGDPNNLYLNGHLRAALGRKLDVLRRAVSLPVS